MTLVLQKSFAALGRLPQGEMNKTETEHAWTLEMLKRAGEVLRYEFQTIRLVIGKGCTYEPDFVVQRSDRVLEMHEVKGGFITDDAKVKIKAAALQFPYFVFVQYQKTKRGWERTEI